MEQEQQPGSIPAISLNDPLASGLKTMFEHRHDLTKVLDGVVQAAHRLTGCEHVFLTRYDQVSKTFSTAAWESSLNPGPVTLEQKFMGDSYLANQMVFIADLSQYNYRLKSGVARLGLKSMIGIPLAGSNGLFGALECFSHEPNFFSQEQLGQLSLLAKQAALFIEQDDQAEECRLWAIENAFLHEVHASDQSSEGTLLYKLGKSLGDLFAVDGITVFGLEPESQYDVLQEVIAIGFTTQDVTALKKSIHSALLDKLLNQSDFTNDGLFMKHNLSTSGSEVKKVLTIVPVAWRKNLYGLVVYFRTKPIAEDRQARVERFAARMIDYLASVLNRKTLYNTIQRVSLTDALTQLPNRRLFDYILAREFEKVKRGRLSLGLLMVDIDFFKDNNDQFGHQAGDAILEQLGGMLKNSFRSIDLPARYGGEEFAVILPDTDMKSALGAAERFREEVAAAVFAAGNLRLSVTVSIGIAIHNNRSGQCYCDQTTFLHAADQALYQAKEQGRNRVVVAKVSG
jgi:diguanylate cyclase (GGDEF)-like protein